jgi:hypothetical protein
VRRQRFFRFTAATQSTVASPDIITDFDDNGDDGHAAIITGADTMIHPNGHAMTALRDAVDEAIGRIGYL